MNRDETIKMLRDIGETIAKKYGYTDLLIGEDRQKGIWGERLTAHLEEKYGECTQEIKWVDPENNENYVQFRFRFANPVISHGRFDRGDDHSHYASQEFSDFHADWSHYDEDRILPTWRGGDGEKTGHFVDYVHNGEFRCTEKQVWGEKGNDFDREITELIADYVAEHERETEEMER